MCQKINEHSNLDSWRPGRFASTKLHQVINEGKEKTNEKPSLPSDNEGNE